MIEDYLNDPAKDRSQKTKDGYQVIFDLLAELIGNMRDVKTITHQECERLRAAADVAYVGRRWGGTAVDDTDRVLCRRFNMAPPDKDGVIHESWDRGGRLYGGFWQPLSKQQRRDGIRINGEPVVTLDYGQMNPRLLYARLGVPMPVADAYAIPGFEGHRKGIKKVFNAALFAEKPLDRFPKDTVALFPARSRFGTVIEAIAAAHPAIEDRLFTDIGHRLMFDESEILMDLLARLMAEGIVALPIHDAMVIQASKVDRVEVAMKESFRACCGVEGVVSREE